MHRTRRSRRTFAAIALAGLCAAAAPASAGGETSTERRALVVQSRFPPLFIADAPPEGAHPIGGPAFRFVEIANAALEGSGLTLALHTSEPVPAFDEGRIAPPVVELGGSYPTLHAAVAAGAVEAGIGLANMNGHPFGELLVAGLPFGLAPDEFLGWLYGGGGLTLQEALYDEAFDGSLVVLPVAVTGTQGGGWFPEPLPDPELDPDVDAQGAMRTLCEKRWIVRWPEPGASVWRRACAQVGVQTEVLGPQTRCRIQDAPCPSPDNPAVHAPATLAFGGFVPGGLPQDLVLLGQIDGWELNLPSTDVLMMKLVTGQGELPNAEADLSAVIERAPYFYGQSWHQTLSYIELIVHRDAWESLTDRQRTILRTAAKAATLDTLARALARQGAALDQLSRHGAVVLRWPPALLQQLREASAMHLDERAEALARTGDERFRRLLRSLRDYAEANRVYHDFGDINQGRANVRPHPKGSAGR